MTDPTPSAEPTPPADPASQTGDGDEGNWKKLEGMIKGAVKGELAEWDLKKTSSGASGSTPPATAPTPPATPPAKKKSFWEKVITG